MATTVDSLTVLEIGDCKFALVHDANLPDDLYGVCDHEKLDGVLRIDSTLRGKEYVDTVIHEWLHALCPAHREDWVKDAATQITALIFTAEFLRRAGLD